MEGLRSTAPSRRSSNSASSPPYDPVPPLRYHNGALWLLLIYVLLIVLPWTLTCVLAQRPLGAKSYTNQRGFTDREVDHMRAWRIAVAVTNAIAALVTVPILSTALAQAVVVFCQRRRSFSALRGCSCCQIADGRIFPYYGTHCATLLPEMRKHRRATKNQAGFSCFVRLVSFYLALSTNLFTKFWSGSIPLP